ncbi:MAG: N-acetylmuramoyl-L-alanine amidase family protein [Luteibaculaceae bacterium]
MKKLKLWVHSLLVLSALLFFCQSLFADDSGGGKAAKKFTVVIDAGHGGKDPGAVGTGRFKKTEKDIALDVSLKLGAYIKQNLPDVEVIYTRDKDVFITLAERPKIANKANADLFISIHCNSTTNKTAYGTETFVMGLHKSKENLEVARKENSVIFLEDNYEENYEGFDPNSPESMIALTLRQSAYLEHSLSFAALVQNQFRERVGRVDRGVKQAGLWVISHTTMPSVLVELGFISNPKEEEYLNTEQGQDYLASAIFRAFKEYKNYVEKVNASISDDYFAPEVKLEVSTPVSVPATELDAVFFSVQLMSAAEPVKNFNKQFRNLNEIFEFNVNGVYKYTFGKATSYAEAQRLQKEALDKGYQGCFIIAFRGSNQIAVREAIDLTSK